MKYLKIENNKGFYLKSIENSTKWEEIDKINKTDLLDLLKKAVSSDFEMDGFAEDTLANKAHQLIYKNIFEKFSDIASMKSKFKDESEILYRDAIEKYSKLEEAEPLARAADGA